MIKKGKHIIKSHMTLEYEFSGIRMQHGFLTPVDWALSINLIATHKKNKGKEDAEQQASMTYQKLYFWLDTNLPNIVAVNVENEDDLYLANLSSNIMMYCPGNPGDDMIVQLLHAKLSVLAEPNLIVSEIRLKGSDTSLQYSYDCDDGNRGLPETTSYYVEGSVKDELPWWDRDDGFCFEFIRPIDDNGDIVEDDSVFDSVVDPMSEFYKIINEIDTRVGLMKEPANIVQVEKWKPKKVEE